MKKYSKKTILPITFCILALLLGGVFFLFRSVDPSVKSDYKRMQAESYDTALVSMFPVESYPNELFQVYRNMTLFKAQAILPDMSSIENYLRKLTSSDNTVTTVYLGLRPDKIKQSDLIALIESYPSISFEIILSYPSMEYWKSLSEAEYARVLDSYCNFLFRVDELPSGNVYFYGSEEWLVTNPSLYVDTWTVTDEVGEFISANSYYIYPYLVTQDNAQNWVDSLYTLTYNLRNQPTTYPNLSNTELIFFGDSVFGNFNDGMSIPGVIKGLTGASVYNCALGGTSATDCPDTVISVPAVVNAFFANDLSPLPEGTQIYRGFEEYFSSQKASKTCYILNYGINDFYNGCDIASDDPFDVTTYVGALRTAISQIKEKSADSQIILCTPTTVDFIPEGAVVDQYSQEEYAMAVLALADELNLDVADNYHLLDITPATATRYLADGVHPNEASRFLIAQNIIRAIK